MARRVLYIDTNGCEVWQCHAGNAWVEARHPSSEEGLAEFARYIAANRHCQYQLLVDLPDEGFHTETAPYVTGADRQALIARKLSQHFYGSSLTLAFSLGREREGRRDERLLFAALTRPQLVEPWLAVLREAEIEVAGIWSPPLLTPSLLGKLAVKNERALLLTIGAGGIRQTYVEQGKLRFSRLTAQPNAGPADLAAACSTEATKLYQYLCSQRMLTRGTLLPVLVLVHAAQAELFKRQLPGSDELEFVITDIASAAEALGLKSAPPDSFSAPLFIRALATAAPAEQFAPGEERRFFQLGRARKALLAGGMALLLGCLGMAGNNALETWRLDEESVLTAEQAQSDLRRYQNLLAELPPLPTDADTLRRVVDRYDQIEQRATTPEPLLRSIGQALDTLPLIELDRVEWFLATQPDALPQAAQGDQAREAEPPSYAIALITGHLQLPADAEQRRQIEAVNAFVAELKRDDTLAVSSVRMPFDLESQRALRSDTAAATEAPRFAVRVARKLP